MLSLIHIYRIDSWDITQNFQSDCPLPGHNILVIKGVDKHRARFLLDLQRLAIGFVITCLLYTSRCV